MRHVIVYLFGGRLSFADLFFGVLITMAYRDGEWFAMCVFILALCIQAYFGAWALAKLKEQTP